MRQRVVALMLAVADVLLPMPAERRVERALEKKHPELTREEMRAELERIRLKLLALEAKTRTRQL